VANRDRRQDVAQRVPSGVVTAKLILGAGGVLAAPLFAGALLAGALGSAAPLTAGLPGGLVLQPQVVRRAERVIVTNTSARAVRVTLRARPWVQGTDGSIAPDPHRELRALVRLSPASFTLPPGARRAVRVTLLRPLDGGSLYGALDVTGTEPVDGAAVRHRLIGSLYLDPARPRYRILAGAPEVAGRTVLLPVQNVGNTAEPITGRAEIVGPGGTRTVRLKAVRVMPRRLVLLTLAPRAPGRHRVAITLMQAGRIVLRETRTVRVS